MDKDPVFAAEYRKKQRKYDAPDASRGKYKRRSALSRWLTYGWTEEMVENARTRQEGRCAVCKKALRLVPDHKHSEPPLARELLCHRCNLLVGVAEASPGLLESIWAYLVKWS